MGAQIGQIILSAALRYISANPKIVEDLIGEVVQWAIGELVKARTPVPGA